MKETKFKQTLVQTKDERRKTKESTRHCEERSDVAIQGDFKMTEVGLIPNDWGVKKIGELCSITTGSQNTQDHKEDGKYPFFVRSQEVERIDKYIFDTEGVVTAGDGVGTGKIFHYVNGKFGLHQRCYLMYEFDRNISAKYFYWIFSVNFYDRVHSMTAKSSVDSVRREMIADMPIALPPIKEQQRIANALSDVDTLIANLEKLIAKKKNIKQGAMQQLLTGRKRLPGFGSDERQKECHSERSAKREVEESSGYKMTELGMIPSDWEVKKIGDFCKVYDGTHQTPHYVDVGIPFYSVENVSADDFEHTKFISNSEYEFISKRASIEKGDVLMTRIGSIGVCKYVDWDCKSGFYVSLSLLKCNEKIDARYLCQQSKSEAFKKEIELHSLTTAIPQKINLGPISQVRIIVPHSKAEQTAIANVLSDMDAEISALETKLAKYRTLKTGMMQQLLTGKIRLV